MDKIALRVRKFSDRVDNRRDKRTYREPIRAPAPTRHVDALHISPNVLRRVNEKTSADWPGASVPAASLTSRQSSESQTVGNEPPELLFKILRIQVSRIKRAKTALQSYEREWKGEQEVSEELYKKYGAKYDEGLSIELHRTLDGAILRRLEKKNQVKVAAEQCRRAVKRLESVIANLKQCICEKYMAWNMMDRRSFLEEQLREATETSFCERCFLEVNYLGVMQKALHYIQGLRHAQRHSGTLDYQHPGSDITIQSVRNVLEGTSAAEKGCTTCFSVIYCCADHRLADEAHHSSFCCQSLAHLKLFDLGSLFEKFDAGQQRIVQPEDFFSASVGRVEQILESHETKHNERQMNMRKLKEWTSEFKAEVEKRRPNSARHRSRETNPELADSIHNGVADLDHMKLLMHMDKFNNFLHRISDQQRDIRRFGATYGVSMLLNDSVRNRLQVEGQSASEFDPLTQFNVLQILVEMKEKLKLRDIEVEKYKLQRDDALQSLKENRELFSREFSRQKKQFDIERQKLVEERERLLLQRHRLKSISMSQKYPSPDYPSEFFDNDVNEMRLHTAKQSLSVGTQTEPEISIDDLRKLKKRIFALRTQHRELSTVIGYQFQLALMELSKAQEKFAKLVNVESQCSFSVQQMHLLGSERTGEGTRGQEQMPKDDFIVIEPSETQPPSDTETVSVSQTLPACSSSKLPMSTSYKEDPRMETGQNDRSISLSHGSIHGDVVPRLSHESAVVSSMERSMSLLSIASTTSIASGTCTAPTKRKKPKVGSSLPSRTTKSRISTAKGRKGISKVDMKLLERGEN